VAKVGWPCVEEVMSAIVILLLITVLSGAAGGVASYTLEWLSGNEPEDIGNQSKESDLEKPYFKISHAFGYAFVGVVAAFSVPLFLALAQSNLTDLIFSPDNNKFFQSVLIFAGFCVVLSFASRTLLNTLSQRLLSSVQNLDRRLTNTTEELKEVKNVAASVEESFENSSAEAVEEPAEVALTEPAETQLRKTPPPAVDFNEAHLLRAFMNKPNTRRSQLGLSRDAHFEMAKVLETLGGLRAKGYVEEVPSKKTGKPVYRLTHQGQDFVRGL
jgi:hypothetical protein